MGAAVTKPLFSADRRLLVPERSHLPGDVEEAQSARSFHRDGKVLFTFRQIKCRRAPCKASRLTAPTPSR